MELVTQSCCWTCGTSGSCSRVQGHPGLPSCFPSAPSGAPMPSIQRAMRSISPADRASPPKGMAGCLSPRKRSIRGLSALLPAMTAGPSRAPPSSSESVVSRTRSLRWDWELWQLPQLLSRMGRISCSKPGEASVGFGAPRPVPLRTSQNRPRPNPFRANLDKRRVGAPNRCRQVDM